MTARERRWPTALVAEGFHRLGWRKPTTARELYDTTNRFQLGWNLGPALKFDGDPGPATCTALKTSLDRQDDGKTTASANFSFTEFACKCGGVYDGCERIIVTRQLLVGLEVYRHRLSPSGVSVVSGFRCAQHNRTIHSVDDSRHTRGEACDIEPVVSWQAVRGLRVFTGIGYQRGTGRARHVDTRGTSIWQLPARTPHASVTAPAVWLYG